MAELNTGDGGGKKGGGKVRSKKQNQLFLHYINYLNTNLEKKLKLEIHQP